MGAGLSSPAFSLERSLGTDPSDEGYRRDGTGSRYQGEYFNAPGWYPESGYASIITGTIITVILLVIINYTLFPIFSFIPGDGGLVSVPIASDRQLMFTKAPAASDLSGNFSEILPYNYTLGADVYLSGSFQASSMPRVILYRSRAANTSLNVTDTKDKLLERFPDTNLIIWMDPIKNDLFVSVITGNSANGTLRLQTTKPIANVPIRKVFRITIVYADQFIEVYKDGSLEQSMAFQNTPIASADTSYFFPSTAKTLGSAMISNVAYWPRILVAREVRRYGTPMSNETFFSKKI
jgi:hypothetical protein